jgi:hypothetical protein
MRSIFFASRQNKVLAVECKNDNKARVVESKGVREFQAQNTGFNSLSMQCEWAFCLLF